MLRTLRELLTICAWILVASLGAVAEDWPMWRYDASRTAASPEQLPENLQLQWVRELGPREPAWDDALNLDLMTYDRVFEPIVSGGRLYLGFNDRDKLSAYDLETGDELWSFFADGPIRLPPVAWKDRVFVASDDGKLYSLNAADGTLTWSFLGGPNSRQILGNKRLISAWPMRGGPVVRDDRVYCAASIWPFMGTYIYALDAETGTVVWVNDETGAQYVKQPHSAPSFAGVAPQGALVATQDSLIVPGGRSVPAAFDRNSGKLLYFEMNAGGKGTGGSFVAASEDSWFVHTREKGTREFSLKTGLKTAFLPNEPVLTRKRIFSAESENEQSIVRAYDNQTKDMLWEFSADGRGDLILAGDTLFAAGNAEVTADGAAQSLVAAIHVPEEKNEPAARWTSRIPGTVQRLLAANGKLIVVTLEGSVFVYGDSGPRSSATIREAVVETQPPADVSITADHLLRAGAAEGYAFWFGAANEPLLSAMVSKSPFVELTIFDEDRERIARMRERIDLAGRYGKVTVRSSAGAEFLPPYVANMLFVGSELVNPMIRETGRLNRLYESVRPYGGLICLLADPAAIPSLCEQIREFRLEQAEIEATDFGVVVRRAGPLPGAGIWTHQNGDVANTIKSDDQRVKLPLGVLWFGGVGNEDVLPRHGHGPPEQVVGGRLYIQGMNSLTARDVYTGRVHWKRDFDDLGTHDVYFDDTYKETPLDTAYNQVHIPGANARGTNYVATTDRIYIIEGATCHVLDPATGQTMLDIELPRSDPAHPNEWGYIGVYENVLMGGMSFASYSSRLGSETDTGSVSSRSRSGFGSKILDRAASMALVGFDRHTGEQLWKVDAMQSFWHNGIVAGNGLVYATDRNPKDVEEFLRRRGQSDTSGYRIVAFNVKSGQLAWELKDQVFGTWLGYSQQHDLLLQAGATASDRLSSEVGQGMAVYRGVTGELVWQKPNLKYSGPCVLHNDLIITNANSNAESAGAFFLNDGTQKLVENSLTGEMQPWKLTRAYGCNSIIASENLLTFRSGAAGFYDLKNVGGTGNLGGFKSGCTSNLVVADGVLNAPDYTRTCSCAYQNQTSLALVHMPELDSWTVSNTEVLEPSNGHLRRLGVNLGAPGDRRDPRGLMWLEYPAVAGDAPNLGLEFAGETRMYQDQSSVMERAEIPWVASSGVEGMTSLRLSLTALPRHTLQTGMPVDRTEDDSEEAEDGTVTLNNSSLKLGTTQEVRQLVGFRFNSISLAVGANIRSATLQLSARAVSAEPCELVIRAQASGHPQPFSEKPHDLSGRVCTSSEVRWSPAEWKKAGESGPDQRSPDLAPLIREVIEGSDWQPGGSIVLLISGSGQRDVSAFRGQDSSPARLFVDAEDQNPAEVPPQALHPYRLRLHFGLPANALNSERVFDVEVNDQATVKTMTLGGPSADSQVETLDRVLLGDWLELKFVPHVGEPVLSGIELERLAD